MGNGFRELRVWQNAKRIAVEVYLLIRQSPSLEKDLGLKDQMQRAAVSIASNIAEGDARSKSDKDSIRFFHYVHRIFSRVDYPVGDRAGS